MPEENADVKGPFRLMFGGKHVSEYGYNTPEEAIKDASLGRSPQNVAVVKLEVVCTLNEKGKPSFGLPRAPLCSRCGKREREGFGLCAGCLGLEEDFSNA